MQRVWSVLYLILGKHHSYHPKKNKKQTETRKQVRRWRKIQGSKCREIGLITKNVWQKRNENLFRRNWLIHHVKVILILLLKEHVLLKNIHSDIVNDDDEVGIPSTLLKNSRANRSYPRSCFTQSSYLSWITQ